MSSNSAPSFLLPSRCSPALLALGDCFFSSSPFLEPYSEAKRHWPVRDLNEKIPRFQSDSKQQEQDNEQKSMKTEPERGENDESLEKPRGNLPFAMSSNAHWFLLSYHSFSDSVLVYQAYNDCIADSVLSRGNFLDCPSFSLSRMTWIKPNFLWMMYRSGWSWKDSNQSRILAIFLKKSAFERYLSQGRPASKSDCLGEIMEGKSEQSKTSGKQEKSEKPVIRIQWDPDHTPYGGKVFGRRAIQMGLKNIQSFLDGSDWNGVADITEFVRNQWENSIKPHQLASLWVPIERIYEPTDPKIKEKHFIEESPIR